MDQSSHFHCTTRIKRTSRNYSPVRFIAGVNGIKMLHRSTSALYLVYLSALAVGFPISNSSHNTKDSTRTELLDAGQNERTVTTESITSTTADSPGNNIKGSYSEPSAAVGALARGRYEISQPVHCPWNWKLNYHLEPRLRMRGALAHFHSIS